MTVRLVVPIVEGHGDWEALPAVVRRIAADAPSPFAVRVNPPIRVKVGSFLNDPAYFSRYVALAAAKAAQDAGLVLILLDCEDQCPAQLGPALLQRARTTRGDVAYLVALAHREFETWFVAAARSLRGIDGFAADAEPPPDPEAFRDAKGWLGARMTPHGYDPVVHQLAMGRRFDLQQARAVPSFDRLYRRLGRFVATGTATP